jgi:hypothetical protein
MYKRSSIIRIFASSLLAGAGFIVLASSAEAQCIPVEGREVGPDARFVEIEGPLANIDLDAQTIQVFDTCLELPAGVLVDTDGDGLGDFTLRELLGDGRRSPIGGTIAALATTDSRNGGYVFIADSVYFEFAEHVVVGPLLNVDLENNAINIAGTTVVLSRDYRVPPVVYDLSFNPIKFSDLESAIGTTATAEGWFEDGILNAKVVETEAVVGDVGEDGVGIERAQFRADRGELRVTGVTTEQFGTGRIASFVDLDLDCTGTDLIRLDVLPGDVAGGAFDYRDRGVRPVAEVCVTSELGGSVRVSVTQR